MKFSNRLLAEFLGTAMLLATVVGSGIMAENMAGGNAAIALLGNTIPTGAILFVIITMFGPISGAHFNPAVTIAFAVRNEFPFKEVLPYILVQIVAGIIGVWAANFMFDLNVIQISEKVRSSQGQWFSEGVATFGLLLTIFLTLKSKAEAVPAAVGMYIIAAYWFTASTSFANPAVTIARQFSNTFAGIAPASVPAFITAQCVALIIALLVIKKLK